MEYPKAISLLLKSVILFCCFINFSVAQTILNDPYAIDIKGFASDYKFTPDGMSVVYLKFTMGSSSQMALGVSSISNSRSIELYRTSPNVFFSEDIQNYSISSNGKYVVYTVKTRESTGARIESTKLWSIPIVGGAAIELSNDPVGVISGRKVVSYVVSPDSTSVVYLSNSVHEDKFELFSVPITGGARTRLDTDGVISGNVMPDFQVTEQGNVIFRTEKSMDGASSLFISAITGGLPTKLNKSTGVLGEISDFKLSENERSVTYRATSQLGAINPSFNYLYNVVVATGGVAQISDIDTADDFQHSDDEWVVYRSSENIEPAELYAVNISDVEGTTVTLSLGAEPLDVNEEVVDFKVVPNSNQVLFRVLRKDALAQNSDFVELYSVNLLSNTSAKLSGIDDFPGNVTDYQVSADGNNIVYIALDTSKTSNFVVVSSAFESKILFISRAGINEGATSGYTSAIISNDGNYVLAESEVIFGTESLTYISLNPATPNDAFRFFPEGSFSNLSFNGLNTHIVFTGGLGISIPVGGEITGSNLLAGEIAEIEIGQEMCFPIKTGFGEVSVVCL